MLGAGMAVNYILHKAMGGQSDSAAGPAGLFMDCRLETVEAEILSPVNAVCN